MQLNTIFPLQNPSKECEPYRTSEGKPIAPCGAIANSLFNGKNNEAVFVLVNAHSTDATSNIYIFFL